MYRAITISLFGFLISLSLLSCGNGSSPAHVAEEFVRLASLGDYEAAEELVSEGSLAFFRESQENEEESMLGEDFDKMISEKKKQKALADLAKMHFSEGEINADRATVYVTNEDYPGQRHTVILVKEKGGWKVDLENSSLIAAARASALKKTCFANMRTVLSMSNVYAAANDGVYPTSWEDMLDGYLEEVPVCPLDDSQYHVEWHVDTLPYIECPNHGRPEPPGF